MWDVRSLIQNIFSLLDKKMPAKCCVPMCTSGYNSRKKCSEKIPIFSTKDKKLQLQWSKAIPRKNYKVNDKSYVCAHHFTEADIKKGFYIQVEDKQIFKEQRWSLQPNSIPTVFPNCSAHFSKGTKKVKLDDNDRRVSKKVKLDQQFATERSKIETADNIIQLKSETEGEVTQREDETFQFNAGAHDNQVVDAIMQLDTERDATQLENVNWEKDIENFVFARNWSYCKMEEEFHIFKVEKDKGNLSIEKNVVLSNGNLSYQVKKASVPRNEEMLPSLLTSIDMLKNVINTFEKLELCGGISLVSHSQDVQEKIKLQVTEGYEECNVWRSYSCRRVLQLMSSKYPNQQKHSACQECRDLKITLMRHIWNFKRMSLSNKLLNCRKEKNKAQRTATRRSVMLNRAKKDLHELRSKLVVNSKEAFDEYIQTLEPELFSESVACAFKYFADDLNLNRLRTLSQRGAVTSGNVDQREQLQLLVSYKDCLLGKCKTERKKASFLRSTMARRIFEKLIDRDPENEMELTTDPQTKNFEYLRFLTEEEALPMEKEPPSEEDLLMAKIKKHMVYNLCGYVLYSRKNFLKCQDCRNTLETSFGLLPNDFCEAVATNCKDRGGLKYCTKEMFNLFSIVEDAYREEVNVGSLNILDWFERTMDTLGCLAKEKKFNIDIFCEIHCSKLVGKLVLEYLIIRNHLETKKWVRSYNQQCKSKSLRKQAKVMS